MPSSTWAASGRLWTLYGPQSSPSTAVSEHRTMAQYPKDLPLGEPNPEILRDLSDKKLEEFRNYVANLQDAKEGKSKTAKKNEFRVALDVQAARKWYAAIWDEMERRKAEHAARRATKPQGSN
jgi:hypothetical protein